MKYNEKRNNASARNPETAPSTINFAYGSNLAIKLKPAAPARCCWAKRP